MNNPEKHWAQKTQGEDKQNTKTQHNTENWKDEQHGPTKNRGWTQVLAKGKQ
jgi:hypothetical protein